MAVIMLNGAFVSTEGSVDKYSMMFSRLPYIDCVMSKDDVLKLYNLAGIAELPEVKSEERPVEALEAEAAPESSESQDGGEYNSAALAVVVTLMAAAVALTLVLTKKKK